MRAFVNGVVFTLAFLVAAGFVAVQLGVMRGNADTKPNSLERWIARRSLHATLVHILWGDSQWMSRFDGWERPTTPIKESGHMLIDYAELCSRRVKADADIEGWAGKVDEPWLNADLTWFSGAAQREISAPKRLLVTHFFNHQTHHRGQAHALITAAGEKTDDTDLFLVIPQMIA